MTTHVAVVPQIDVISTTIRHNNHHCRQRQVIINVSAPIHVVHSLIYLTSRAVKRHASYAHITHIDYPWKEDVPYWFWGQKFKGQAHWTSKSECSLQALDCYTYHLESPYHTYRLPMGWRCALLILRSKDQRSSILDIEVEIWFPGSRVLCCPLRDTVSHIQYRPNAT